MGLRVRRSFKVAPGLRLNVSKSGLSTSSKLGPLTVNSRGRTTVRLAKGISYSTGNAASSRTQGRFIGAAKSRSRQKSVGIAYVLWLLTGLIGGHRYYLGRTGTAMLQTFTLGGLGVWWLLDFFLIPRMAKTVS